MHGDFRRDTGEIGFRNTLFISENGRRDLNKEAGAKVGDRMPILVLDGRTLTNPLHKLKSDTTRVAYIRPLGNRNVVDIVVKQGLMQRGLRVLRSSIVGRSIRSEIEDISEDDHNTTGQKVDKAVHRSYIRNMRAGWIWSVRRVLDEPQRTKD